MLSFVALIFTVSVFVASGNKDFIRQERPLSSKVFDEIVVDGAFDVSLYQLSPDASMVDKEKIMVAVEASSEAQSHIVVEMREKHILSISVQGHLVNQKTPRIFIRFVGPLRRYSVMGSGESYTENKGITNSNDEPLVIQKGGTTDLILQLNVKSLQLTSQGSGKIQLRGQVRDQAKYEIQGTNQLDTMRMTTKRIVISTEGGSTSHVAASDDIEISAVGSSKVVYKLDGSKKPNKAVTEGSAQIERL